jgi:hypothetical protein
MSRAASNPPPSPNPSCQKCTHFQNDPTLIEQAYPGLTSLSSGYASVRDQDGLCNYHQLYLSARDHCPDFAPHHPFPDSHPSAEPHSPTTPNHPFPSPDHPFSAPPSSPSPPSAA